MPKLYRYIYTFVLIVSGWLLVIPVLAAGNANPGYPGLIAPVIPPRADYSIDASVSIGSDTAVIIGSEKIILTNINNRAIEQLKLFWNSADPRNLDIKVGANPVSLEFPSGKPSFFSPLIASLPQKIEPGQKLELNITFEYKTSVKPDATYYLWTTWFPRIYWGYLSQDNYKVKLDYPSELTLASSGRFDPSDGTYKADSVRHFGIFLGRDMSVMEQMADDIQVRVIHTEKATDCADLILHTAVDAIKFYKKRFGFFPFTHVDIIPGTDQPVGGYPAATSLPVIHGMEHLADRDSLHWQWITAHELGHQYWFEYVMPEPPQEIGWLMIGMGIYMDREYCRYKGFPPTKHQELMERYIDGVRQGVDTRADVETYYIDNLEFDFNNIVVHGKGFSIISALDVLLGDSLFNKIYSRCLHEFGGRRMTDYDFQEVCEEESGQDLDWFFDQWVRTSKILSYSIISDTGWAVDNGYLSEVNVKRSGDLDMPIPITAYFADSSSQTKFTSPNLEINTVSFASKAPLARSILDEKGELANVVPLPTEEELDVRKKIANLPDPKDIAAIPDLITKVLAMDIKETAFWGRLGRKLYDLEYYDQALAVFQKRVKLLEENKSDWAASAYGWQGLLLDLLNRRDDALVAYNKALSIISDDGEYAYNNDPVTITRAWLEERLKTPYEISEN